MNMMQAEGTMLSHIISYVQLSFTLFYKRNITIKCRRKYKDQVMTNEQAVEHHKLNILELVDKL